MSAKRVTNKTRGYEEMDKKPYAPPSISAWGTVSELTGVGQTHPGDDVFAGSVNPKGHEDNPKQGNPKGPVG